jgi:NAD-dependent dihydropyrimidine dehydrogenase PreA subunit
MTANKIYVFPDSGPLMPITFNSDICNGCNRCVEVCQVDIMLPSPEKGRPPIVCYPGECWYCGCCVDICPKPGAIKLRQPRTNSVHYKRKSTGETFRL